MGRVVVVVVVVVTLMQVFTDGMIGIGTGVGMICCGFAIGPHAGLFFLNSISHSLIAFFSARRGWYIFGGRPHGPSSLAPSVSNFISADTVSSK